MTVAPPKRLLVVVPCLNEQDTIGRLIEQVPKAIEGVDVVDVLVVDDGSKDQTAAIALAAGAQVVSHGVNRGVGTAFQSAVGYAIQHKYDFMVNIDGDLQFDPTDIPKIFWPVRNGVADMVTASRFVDKAFTPIMPKVKLVGNHMMSFLISRLVRHRFKDVSCGFRCYSREALMRLNLHGSFTYTQETFLDFCSKGMKILEVPINVVYFPDRQSRVVSSIFKYAFSTAKIIFRGYRDYYPLRFFWSIALAFFIPSMLLAILFFAHFVETGKFVGYLFAGFSSAFLAVMAIVFFVLGIVTDMLDRIRSNQDRILYLIKKGG